MAGPKLSYGCHTETCQQYQQNKKPQECYRKYLQEEFLSRS